MNSDSSDRSPAPRPRRLEAGTATSGIFGATLFAAPLFLFSKSLAQSPAGSAVFVGEILLAVLCVVALNAMFVAGETAIEQLRGSHLKASSVDDATQKKLRTLIDNKPLYVAACFLGSQTMRAWLVIIALVPAFRLLPVVEGWNVPGTYGPLLAASLLVAVPVVAVNVVLGELVPRTFAAMNPVSVARRLSGVVRAFAVVFSPFVQVAIWLGGFLTHRFGARASFSTENQTEEEIRELLQSAEMTGEIEGTEKQMLNSVFDFGDTVAREIMTPRVDLDAVPKESDLQTVARLVEETGHSRIPVYEGSDDQIIGIVHAKDVLSAIAVPGSKCKLVEIMREAVFVPENKKLHELLQEMRNARVQLVIVQDEFGGTAGVVSIEDIVEEVMGEIVDEYDVEEIEIEQYDERFFVRGKANLYDVNAVVGSQFASEEFDTIGGYVFGLFGRQPAIGESTESDGYRFKVEETDGRRIVRLSIELADPSEVGEGPSLVPELS